VWPAPPNEFETPGVIYYAVLALFFVLRGTSLNQNMLLYHRGLGVAGERLRLLDTARHKNVFA